MGTSAPIRRSYDIPLTMPAKPEPLRITEPDPSRAVPIQVPVRQPVRVKVK